MLYYNIGYYVHIVVKFVKKLQKIRAVRHNFSLRKKVRENTFYIFS